MSRDVSKPKRVLLVQALCLIQLAIVAVATASATAALPPGFAASDVVLGLVKPAFGVILLLGLLLSLQRSIPRPETVAPLAAGLWWLSAFCLAIVAWHAGHQSAVTLLGKLSFYAVLLWLIVLVFADGGTRAYLSGAATSDR